MGRLAKWHPGVGPRDHLKNVPGNMVGWGVFQLDLIECRSVLEGICNKMLKYDKISEIQTRPHTHTPTHTQMCSSCRREVSENIVIHLFEMWLHILLSDDALQHCGPGSLAPLFLPMWCVFSFRASA